MRLFGSGTFTLLAGLAILVPGAMTIAKAEVAVPCPNVWIETRLFLGRNIGESAKVSDEQWRDFVSREIVSRFKTGFTVVDAAGYWSGESCKKIDLQGGCEKTKLVVIQYPPSKEADNSVKAIALAYIAKFKQAAVMRSDQVVCTQFYD